MSVTSAIQATIWTMHDDASRKRAAKRSNVSMLQARMQIRHSNQRSDDGDHPDLAWRADPIRVAVDVPVERDRRRQTVISDQDEQDHGHVHQHRGCQKAKRNRVVQDVWPGNALVSRTVVRLQATAQSSAELEVETPWAARRHSPPDTAWSSPPEPIARRFSQA